jgi:hypothetical protein
MKGGVVSEAEAELLLRTHIYRESLHELADSLKLPYKTLQSQRRRIEQRCAGALSRAEGLS